MMLVTRIRSDSPGMPGRRQQMPRTIRSISTPALDASHSASMTSPSTRLFILATMRAGSPARAFAASRAMSAMSCSRRFTGATSSLRYSRWREKPVSVLNSSDTSAPSASLQLSRPKSVYVRAVLEL